MKVVLLTAKPNSNAQVGVHEFAVDEKRPPTGIGYLYEILKQSGIDAKIYDRYSGNTNFDFSVNYDFVGIYCASVCTDDIKFIIDNVKANKIAVGGPHASLFPEWFSPKVNYIVQGEAEEMIVDLVNGKYKDGLLKVGRLDNESLSKIPRFPYKYFWDNKERYTWNFPFSNVSPIFTLNSSRGCIYSCSFCSVKKIWGHRLTMFSAERVFSEIEYVKSFGAKGIYFREDNFTINKKRLFKLCNYMVGAGLEWACETRADSIDEETAKIMSEAGCVGFYIGVESLSQHMLDVYNKNLTVDQIIKCFDLTHKYGIKTAASMIKGHPEETNEDKLQTAALMRRINPTMKWYNQYRSEG